MKIKLVLLLLVLFQFQTPSNADLPMEIEEMAEMLMGRDTPRYNCSSKSREEWRSTGEIHPLLGTYYIVSGLFFQLISWPVLAIFVFKYPMTNSLKVFKIMVFIGVIEATEVWGVSIYPGFAALHSEVYCSSPRITVLVGKVTMIQWITGTTSVIFLGFHRLSELTRIGERFINTSLKTFSWLFLFTLYGIYGSLFYDTVLFNSKYMAPLLDPQISQYLPKTMLSETPEYSNNFLRVHNIGATIVLIGIYIAITVIWSTRNHGLSSMNFTSFQKNILTQSILISMTYTIPALSFVILYFVETPSESFVLFSDISYQLSGGLPFIMYIILNKKVRLELKIWISKVSGINIRRRSATIATTTSNVTFMA